MLIVACDPGVRGAIAFLGDDWAKVVDVPTVAIEGEGRIRRRVHGPSLQKIILENVPDGEDDIHGVIEMLSIGGQKDVEKKQGMFISQGKTFGAIHAVLECMLDEPPHEVYARTWKAWYGLTGKTTQGENQVALAREKATALYPSLGLDLQRACDDGRVDAVLIGHWYRKVKL